MDTFSEGVIAVGFDGTILYANSSACNILEIPEKQMNGAKFASLFFRNPENDAFSQTFIDAARYKRTQQQAILTYNAGGEKKHLRVVTSYLKDNDDLIGVFIVFSDLSELVELQDAAKAMEHINELNRKLQIRNEYLSHTFGRFFSDDVVRQLLDTPGGLVPGGKKQTVSVMMSDLRGFTAISERMDASDLLIMLNHYLGEMTEIIQRRHGTIIEFIGDGILAVFGAPVESSSHTSDAVAAALEMELAMDGINRWNAERDFPVLEMGIGLDTGEAIVGIIGSEKRMKYGVAGNLVNVCSRIESYTVGKQILISPAVRERIPQKLEVASEIRVLPKGTEHELVLSHVTGIGEPYNLYFHTKEDTPAPIAEPIPVCFHKLEGKHTQKKTCYGGFVSIGHDGAVLETSVTLNPFDNIVVTAGGRLFCKVMDLREGAYLLHFTSIPLGYKKWLREVCP